MTHSDVRKILSKRKVKRHFDEFSLWARQKYVYVNISHCSHVK